MAIQAQAWAVVASAENDGGTGACGPIGTGNLWYSELSTNPNGPLDFAALGNLPCNLPLQISNPANGKSVVARKIDKGAGSSFLPVMGLYPATVAALGLSGGEFHVDIQRTDGAALSPVRGTPVSPTSSTGNTTGTTNPNTTSASPWVVGSQQNPNQDYWTTINQYCQQAQWYCMSDGQSLIIADGIEIMGQTPKAVIDRYDPAVLEIDATWDNSSFSFTTTHIKKGGLNSPAALAKVASPTSVTLKLLCDVDAFQAGNTVGLSNCGPADGLWLVGQTQRSVFQAYTDITLVQGMQPLNVLTGTTFQGTPGVTPPAPFSNTNKAYVNPFAKALGLVTTSIDDGVDFQMTVGSDILAIGDLKVVGPPAGSANATNWYAGQPQMVFQLMNGSQQGRYYYIAEQITPIAGLGALVNAGAPVCSYASSGTGIEIGWAANSGGTTLAQANGIGGRRLGSGGPLPTAGINFAQFLVSLGVSIKLSGFTG